MTCPIHVFRKEGPHILASDGPADGERLRVRLTRAGTDLRLLAHIYRPLATPAIRPPGHGQYHCEDFVPLDGVIAKEATVVTRLTEGAPMMICANSRSHLDADADAYADGAPPALRLLWCDHARPGRYNVRLQLLSGDTVFLAWA